MTEKTARTMMAAARTGAQSLRRLSLTERLEHLRKLRKVILRESENIIDAVQTETHKSRSDILMSEMFGALDAIAWLESNAKSALADESIPTPMTLMGKKSRIFFEPRGVQLVISPWNYPFYQAIVPVAFAIAAGNTVLYKPSEHTPLEGVLEKLFESANFAPNWVQIAYGDGQMGADLIAAGPDHIMFTGSTATGRKIAAAAGARLIPVELELGGKDPMIVFADVNLTRTVQGAAFGALTASGQSCTSVERLLLQESIADGFIAELTAWVESLTQADSPEKDNDLGGMVVDFQADIVAAQVAEAKEKGAIFHTGGDWDGNSRIIPPMVVSNLPEDSLLWTEETFGPVIPIRTFTTEEDAIQQANAGPYGLTASVWSADSDRAERVARALHCGGVSINNVMATEATPALPFGGVGASGLGRYKGVDGLRAFTNAKSVVIDSDSDKVEANWYPYTAKRYDMFVKMMRAWFSDGPTRIAKFGIAGLKLENYVKGLKR